MTESKTIHVAAVVIQDPEGRVLTVRKRGTSRFMQPGGKPEPGETPLQTALRETREELDLPLRSEQLELMGQFSAAAANEPGHTVVCTNYRVSLGQDATAILRTVKPAAEIEELRWFRLDELVSRTDVAPLLTDVIADQLRSAVT